MKTLGNKARIILLHHSTGGCVWRGGVPEWFAAYNREHATDYQITEQAFPKKEPYGWRNYPYDYWNLWVNHAGDSPFMDEPTLEMLTQDYDVIIFKHCFPVSAIQADTGSADVACEDKRLENYILQYKALKAKLHEFPDTRFVVWTAAALVEAVTNEQDAQRTRRFVDWVNTEWNSPGDNVFIWDFYALETEGGLYLKGEYANGAEDPHPNEAFCRTAAPSLCETIVQAIQTDSFGG
jgi:hypothetical protein